MRTMSIEDITPLFRNPRPLDEFEWRFFARVTRPTFIEDPNTTVVAAAIAVGIVTSFGEATRTTLRVNGKVICNESWDRDQKVEALNAPMPWVDDWASMWTGKKLTNAKTMFTETDVWNIVNGTDLP